MPDAGMVAGHALPTIPSMPSPDVVNPMVEDLNSSAGKGQLHRPNSFVSAYRRVFDQNRGVFGPRSPKIDTLGNQKLDFGVKSPNIDTISSPKLGHKSTKNDSLVRPKLDIGQKMSKSDSKNYTLHGPKLGFGQKLDSKFDTLARQKLGFKAFLPNKQADSKVPSSNNVQSSSKPNLPSWAHKETVPVPNGEQSKITKLVFTQPGPGTPVAPKRTHSGPSTKELITEQFYATEKSFVGVKQPSSELPIRFMASSNDMAPPSAYPASPRPLTRQPAPKAGEAVPIKEQVKALKTVEEASKALKVVERPAMPSTSVTTDASTSKAGQTSTKSILAKPSNTVLEITAVSQASLTSNEEALTNTSNKISAVYEHAELNSGLNYTSFNSETPRKRPTILKTSDSLEIHSPVFSKISPVTSPAVSFPVRALVPSAAAVKTSAVSAVYPSSSVSSVLSSVSTSSKFVTEPASSLASKKLHGSSLVGKREPFTTMTTPTEILSVTPSHATISTVSSSSKFVTEAGSSSLASKKIHGSPLVGRKQPLTSMKTTSVSSAEYSSPSHAATVSSVTGSSKLVAGPETVSSTSKNLHGSPIVGRRIPLSTTNQNIISFFEQKQNQAPPTPSVVRRTSFKTKTEENSKPLFPTDTMKDFNTDISRTKASFAPEPKISDLAPKSSGTNQADSDQVVFRHMPSTSMVAKTKAMFEVGHKENILNYMPLKKSRTFSSFPTEFGGLEGGNGVKFEGFQPSPPKRSSSRKVIAEYQESTLFRFYSTELHEISHKIKSQF